MNQNNKMFKQLWKHISKKRRKQFFLVLFLMILSSFAEIISIGSVLPFLGVLTAPEQIYHNQLFQPLIQYLGLEKPEQLIFPVTLLFIFAAVLAGIIRMSLLYVIIKFSFATGSDLSVSIYRRTLYQNYLTHVSRNSSDVINSIITKTDTVISGILTPILILISSAVMMIGIMSILLTIDAKIALSAFFGFGSLYWGVIWYTRKYLKENSQTIADESTKMIKSLQEGLGGIRDVLIDGSQEFYSDLYRNSDVLLRKAMGNNSFIGGSPRYAMEALGMSLIALLAYLIVLKSGDVSSVIPVLGALAIGAQKMLPTLQQAYASYSGIKGAKSSFQDVLNLLEQPLPEYSNSLISEAPLLFNKKIQLNNLSFHYTKEDKSKKTLWVLKNINLELTKGERIGFIGETGSGKSTLLDIVMGLLVPSEGELLIDEQLITGENRRAWQQRIAHVPQFIYLSDSSIGENVAFGIPKDEIDYHQVEKALEKSQLSKLIKEWKDGYETYVGERGVRLSGGQRQRIGIARALYKNADVLVFDEATSSLDNETEQAVMEAIGSLSTDLTILIIAHRLTTLKECDKIVKLRSNGVIEVGSYNDMVN